MSNQFRKLVEQHLYEARKKYELTDETIKVDGHTLHRIRALRDFGDVKAGDLGGFIESEDNLSHAGTCWITGDAKIYGGTHVFGDNYNNKVP